MQKRMKSTENMNKFIFEIELLKEKQLINILIVDKYFYSKYFLLLRELLEYFL